MSRLWIAGGTIYDPANGIDGVVGDLFIDDGKFVATPSPERIGNFPKLDATSMVVMPGGVDMHAHIAGPKVNFARKLRPEDRRRQPVKASTNRRSGTCGSTPTTFVTGYLYAGLGYTTVFDAAIPPLGARHTHEEFHDTPIIDKGFFVLAGNHLRALELVSRGDQGGLARLIGWLIASTRGYALKIVNPGGVEMWKHGAEHTTGIDTQVEPFNITPRQIVAAMAQAAIDIGLPHPVHIHANRLGLPGNWETTLATIDALEGRRGHLTHIQFHSYGGKADDPGSFRSAVPELVEVVNRSPHLSVDVGQVMFGDTTSMTGDGPLGHYLHRVVGRKWFNAETELEAGCGIVPIEYKDSSLIHTIQWAVGLEWYLLMADPWRIALTTDHPNGGSFRSYPEIIRLLMDANYRRERIARLPQRILQRTVLADLNREYTLNEIAIITRAAPARLLGLSHKGHFGIGADGDVTIYTPCNNRQTMFEFPRQVIKAGEIVIDEGELRTTPFGPTIVADVPLQDEAEMRIWFERYYSLKYRNFAVDDFYLTHGERRIARHLHS